MSKITEHERFNLFLGIATVLAIAKQPGIVEAQFMADINEQLRLMAPGAPRLLADRLDEFHRRTTNP